MSHAILFGLLALVIHLAVLFVHRRYVVTRVSEELSGFLARAVPAVAVGLTLVAGILTGLIPAWDIGPVVIGTLAGVAVATIGGIVFASVRGERERPER